MSTPEPGQAGLSIERLSFGMDSDGPLDAILMVPTQARALFVYGHGAGAGMEHPFMTGVARRLAQRGVATLRYNFPYMEAGKGGPTVSPFRGLAPPSVRLENGPGGAPSIPSGKRGSDR